MQTYSKTLKVRNYLGLFSFMGVSFTAFRSGYSLQVLIRYAHCGLSAAIPHAGMRVHTHGVNGQ